MNGVDWSLRCGLAWLVSGMLVSCGPQPSVPPPPVVDTIAVPGDASVLNGVWQGTARLDPGLARNAVWHNHLFSLHGDGQLRQWTPGDAQPLLVAPGLSINQIKPISSTKNALISGKSGVFFLDTTNGNAIKPILSGDYSTRGLAISAGGRFLVHFGDTTVGIYDISEKRNKLTLEIPISAIYSAQFIDDRRVVIIDGRNEIIIWNFINGKIERRFAAINDDVLYGSSPNGQYTLASRNLQMTMLDSLSGAVVWSKPWLDDDSRFNWSDDSQSIMFIHRTGPTTLSLERHALADGAVIEKFEIDNLPPLSQEFRPYADHNPVTGQWAVVWNKAVLVFDATGQQLAAFEHQKELQLTLSMTAKPDTTWQYQFSGSINLAPAGNVGKSWQIEGIGSTSSGERRGFDKASLGITRLRASSTLFDADKRTAGDFSIEIDPKITATPTYTGQLNLNQNRELYHIEFKPTVTAGAKP
jgi:hypothetical protein